MSSRLLVIPVVHGRMESARRVRLELEAASPGAVAVEVPETIEAPFRRAVERLPLLSVLTWRERSGKSAFFLVEPADGLVEAARWAVERGREVACVDRHTEGYAGHADLVPDTLALDTLTPARFDELCVAGLAPRRGDDDDDARRERTMAFHVRRLLDADPARSVALVCGAAHAERVRALVEGELSLVRPLGQTRCAVELYHLAEEASHDVLSEPGFVQAAYERWRQGLPPSLPSVDPAPSAEGAPRAPQDLPRRYPSIARLALAARDRALAEDGDRVTRTALAVLMRVARNWSLLGGHLSPDLVQLVSCARGVGGEDFAYRFWELATAYPWQCASPGLPVLRPTVEEMYERAAHLRFRRSLRARRHRLRLVPRRPKEKRPGEWKDAWEGDSIVSYPPEDVVVEGYGAYLRRNAVGLVTSDHARTEPLTCSLRDGIDLRETIRNLAHDGRLFVREERPIKGEVGAVIIVFDEDVDDSRYPWTMTWQGEHGQESDMALYATEPGEKMVGPGIARCEYGGFLMTLPPGRMFHVWEDPFFSMARNKPERLILAAVDYASERLLLYVAARPPRSILSAYAARHGKKLLYVPIGQLSPIMLRKVRVFHVLDGRPVRAHARQYIRD